jgi:putative nucleotidyltransferase with HDIG domain
MAEPPSSPGPESRERSPLDALASRLPELPVPQRWASRLVNGVLLLVVSGLSGLLLSPGLSSQQIPVIRAEDVGKPFRASSASGFKAGRDYEIPDKAHTEQHRQEARAGVLPVYDYNPAVVNDVRKALHEAFAGMQDIVAQFEEERPPRETKAGEKEEPGGKKKKEQEATLEEEALGNRLRAERRAFEQRVFQLEEDDFQVLVGARFAPDLERAAIGLVERAYAAPVVGLREDLIQAGAPQVTVRDLAANSERAVSVEQPQIIDIREAKLEMDKAAGAGLLPDRSQPVRRAVIRLAKRQIRPDLTVNTAETEQRRAQAAAGVKEAVIQFKKGQKVLGDGELINESHLVLISAMRAQTDQLDLVQLQLGGAGLVALIVAAAYGFSRAAFRRFRPTRKDALLLSVLLVGALGTIHVAVGVADAVHDKYGQVPLEALYYSIPVATGAMLVRFLLSEELALFFAIVLSCLSGVMLGNSLEFGIYALVGSLVAAERIARARDRLALFKAGAFTGVANALAVFIFALAEGKGLARDTFTTAVFALLATSLLVPMLVMALTPLIEFAFGYASDLKLLELANLNHPALKELIVQAPGTYHHSIIIGSLVENAAEAIGANPLLARSCAYYHDIGKGRNPLYFGENQKGDNRHDQLAPAMSAVIIKRHVTEGLEMARQYRLPKLVADAIPQHHGTRLVGFFYAKALKEQEGKESPQAVDDSVYRYAGPKPQFREAALVMIADAVEAASRAMQEHAAVKLQALVQKLINLIFSEGQLDECDLTLKDLNLIAQSFVHTLEGIYHARVQYPPAALAARLPDQKPPLVVASGGRTDPKRSAGA